MRTRESGRYVTLGLIAVGLLLLFGGKNLGLLWLAYPGFALVVVGSIANVCYQDRPKTRVLSAAAGIAMGAAGLGYHFGNPTVRSAGVAVCVVLALVDYAIDQRYKAKH